MSAPAPDQRPRRARLRLAIDYAGPAAFMAVSLVRHDVLLGTWALVVVSLAALAVGIVVERRVAPFPLIFGGAALVFGTLTLVFHDVRIVKMKTTFIDAGLGVLMLGGLAMGRSPIKLLMGSTLTLPEASWRQLTLRFGIFFLVLAALNEVIWRTQSDAVWVMFRFPGLLILSLLFSATQIPTLMKGASQVERDEAAVRVAETQE